MVAVAVVVVGLSRLPPARLRRLGLASVTAGAVGLSILVGWDLVDWFTNSPELLRYTFQRILFTIGTHPDLPLLQIIAAGAVCWIAGISRRRHVAAS
jgi:hypothetical protein